MSIEAKSSTNNWLEMWNNQLTTVNSDMCLMCAAYHSLIFDLQPKSGAHLPINQLSISHSVEDKSRILTE